MSGQDIREKYELETVPIGIGGKRMEFYRVANLEPFIEKLFSGGKGRFSEFPHWVKIWEASLVLADYLLDTGLKEQSSVLEIGAGMGITGMFLAAFGHRVTITDNNPDCLELLELNARHNGLSNAVIKKLDWQAPDLTGGFDIICGTEVVYQESQAPDLVSLFRRFLNPGGTVYLAHDHQRMKIEEFISSLPADTAVEKIARTFKGKDTAKRIIIHAVSFAEK